MSETTITIPNPAPIVVGNEPWTFFHSVKWVIDSHPAFNINGVGIRASVRLLAAIEGKEPQSSVLVSKEDKKMLREAFDSAPAGLIPTLERENPDGTKVPFSPPGRMLAHFLDAVSDEETKQDK